MSEIIDKLIIDFIRESTGNEITITGALKDKFNHFDFNSHDNCIVLEDLCVADFDVMKFITIIINIINDNIRGDITPNIITDNIRGGHRVKSDGVVVDYYLFPCDDDDDDRIVAHVHNPIISNNIEVNTDYAFLYKTELLEDMETDICCRL